MTNEYKMVRVDKDVYDRVRKFGIAGESVSDAIDNATTMAERRILLKEHNFIDATPDGNYALRILKSYRNMCDVKVSNELTGEPTNPLCIEINRINEKRKIELDAAIKKLTRDD